MTVRHQAPTESESNRCRRRGWRHAAWLRGVFLAACLGAGLGGLPATRCLGYAGPPEPRIRSLIAIASRMLDEAQVSYVYGGSRLGTEGACKACNACLETHQPGPSARLHVCPKCTACSLDCSHFTNLVYAEAGLPYPYLETAAMQSLTAVQLRRNYHLVDLGTDLSQAQAGDLLVYNGHVVMLERLQERLSGQEAYRGDVVHATGGRVIKGPGEGIQRERFVDLARFRGPLRRILRHAALTTGEPRLMAQPTPAERAGSAAAAPAAGAPPEPLIPGVRKLRPVAKHPDDGG